MTVYIGIDPGASGGIAAIDEAGVPVAAMKMPETDKDMLHAFVSLTTGPTLVRAMIERVSSSPQMGRASAFKFGVGYGALRMALAATGIAYRDASPSKWQADMGVQDPNAKGKLGEGRKPRDKNISKRRAQQLFPSLSVITHATAEALLLAEYCRLVETGRLALGPKPKATKQARTGLF